MSGSCYSRWIVFTLLTVAAALYPGMSPGADATGNGAAGASCQLPPVVEEGDVMRTAQIEAAEVNEQPLIDSKAPSEVRTATFAMG